VPVGRIRQWTRALAIGLGLATVALYGCQSGGIDVEPGPDDGDNIGSLSITFTWPPNLASPRALPGFTDVVDLAVRGTSDAGDFEIKRQVTRPSITGTQAAIAIPVPVGSGHQVTAVARDGEGNPLAFGQQTVSITRGTTTQSILRLTPLTSGDDSYPLPLMASYEAGVTTWTGNFGGGETPPARVTVDVFGEDGQPTVGRVVFVIHDDNELWLVQVCGEIVGDTVSGDSLNADFLALVPLLDGGTTPYGGYTTEFSGSVESGDLNVLGIEDGIDDGDASIVVTFAGGLGAGSTMAGTVSATSGTGRRLIGSFECGPTSDDGTGGGVPLLLDQIGIHLETFEGSFIPGRTDDAEVSARQLTFSGLNGLAFIDVFAASQPLQPATTAVTLVMHNETELWQIRGAGLGTGPTFTGTWSRPEHAVDYFPGFTSGIGGYTTDFTGHVLDFSLVAGSFEDPLVEGSGSFIIEVSPDDPTRATGSIEARTESGRTLVGTFSGKVVF